MEGEFAPPSHNFTVADPNATIGIVGNPQVVAGGGLADQTMDPNDPNSTVGDLLGAMNGGGSNL